MNSLSDIINNSTFYFVLVAFLYILVISFVIFLIVRNKKKRIERMNNNSNNFPDKEIEKIDLEYVLDKMQEEVNQTKNDEVKSFEEEREEKAIISYQELINAVKKNVETTVEENSVEQKEETEEAQIVPEKIEKQEEPPKSLSKFQNSEFISPIYGRLDNEIEYPKIPAFKSQEKKDKEDLEKTIIFDAIKDDNSDEFLKALKEFRNNL